MDLSYESIPGKCSRTKVINLVERVVPRYRANSFETRLPHMFHYEWTTSHNKLLASDCNSNCYTCSSAHDEDHYVI